MAILNSYIIWSYKKNHPVAVGQIQAAPDPVQNFLVFAARIRIQNSFMRRIRKAKINCLIWINIRNTDDSLHFYKHKKPTLIENILELAG